MVLLTGAAGPPLGVPSGLSCFRDSVLHAVSTQWVISYQKKKHIVAALNEDWSLAVLVEV